jgi:RND family efflux transporter MFP subunit
MAFVYRKQLTPAIAVDTGTVVLLTEGEDTSTGGGMTTSELLFQASGWIEPDPWPVKVAVLTDGFIEDVFVREGDAVTNGQLLARLDQADARLEREEALAAVAVAAARVDLALDTWTRIDALPPRDTTPAERTAAQATLKAQRGELAASETRLAAADLALERTVIRANMDGRVLHRFVDPGSKRRAAMDDPNSAVIVSLYSPTSLQVRVDVPLAEAGRLEVGQPTRISTAMLPGRVFTGHVTRIVGQADLQRNTLQAKVRIDAPDARLRPEVLCRVEFWSSATAATTDPSRAAGAAGGLALWVPEVALPEPSATEQQVWVVDPLSSTVERRAIRVDRAARDGYRRVLDGLRANETVVTGGAESLTEGRRVTPRGGEDRP